MAAEGEVRRTKVENNSSLFNTSISNEEEEEEEDTKSVLHVKVIIEGQVTQHKLNENKLTN